MADVPPNPKTLRAVMESASRAVGKIDARGVRGLTGLSVAEIEDMAWTLLALGLVPTPPGESPPANLIQREEARDGQ